MYVKLSDFARVPTYVHTQIVRQDRTMEQIVFAVPSLCQHLTDETKARVKHDTKTDVQGSKIDDFFSQTDSLFEEMKCQQQLEGMYVHTP